MINDKFMERKSDIFVYFLEKFTNAKPQKYAQGLKKNHDFRALCKMGYCGGGGNLLMIQATKIYYLSSQKPLSNLKLLLCLHYGHF